MTRSALGIAPSSIRRTESSRPAEACPDESSRGHHRAVLGCWPGQAPLIESSTALLCPYGAAGQLFAAADSRPFAGPALPRLALRRDTGQFGRRVRAASG